MSTNGATPYHQLNDVPDLKQLLNDLERRGLLTGPVLAFGHSYGAMTALLWAAEDPRIDAVVALSPGKDLLSYGPAVRHEAKALYPGLSWFIDTLLTDDFVRQAIVEGARARGFDPTIFDYVAAARKLHVPTLLVHGTYDEDVPYTQGQAIAAANPQSITFWTEHGEGHLSYLEKPDFVQAMFHWVHENVLQPTK